MSSRLMNNLDSVQYTCTYNMCWCINLHAAICPTHGHSSMCPFTGCVATMVTCTLQDCPWIFNLPRTHSVSEYPVYHSYLDTPGLSLDVQLALNIPCVQALRMHTVGIKLWLLVSVTKMGGPIHTCTCKWPPLAVRGSLVQLGRLGDDQFASS